MIEIFCGLISSFSIVMVAVINSRTSKSAKRDEARAARRQEESLLSMELMNAMSKLCVGTALAIKNGTANGEMDEGLQAVKEVSEKYGDFLRRTTAYQVGK